MDIKEKTEKIFPEVDFKTGNIIHNAFENSIFESENLEHINLSNNLFKVEYGNNYSLSIGWYDEIRMFIIHVYQYHKSEYVRSFPMEKRLCRNIVSLKSNLQECITNIEIYKFR